LLTRSLSRGMLMTVWALVAHVVCVCALAAGVREDVGYSTLVEELGLAAPDGSGVPVLMAEGPIDEDGRYQPLQSHPEFLGKTIQPRSPGPPPPANDSGHATFVAQNFFGLATSIAPGISQIEVYEANDFMGNGFMHTGSVTLNPNVSQQASRVGNHSWIASAGTNNSTIDHLARMDWVVERDDFVQVVGVNNGQNGNNPIYSNGLNSIAVGVTNGNHALGTLALGGVYTSGRTKPELVAPISATSWATPIVSAAAANLIETAHNTPALSNGSYTLARIPTQTIYHAETSEVIKAALLAGASRMAFNSDGSAITNYRGEAAQQTANGLDSRFGAGQVNVYNSYHIIAGGEQNSVQEGGPLSVGAAGFDYDANFGGTAGSNNTADYEFTAGWTGQTLAASLVWNAKVDIDQLRTIANKANAVTLNNLNLSLIDITDGPVGQLLISSSGSSQNSENLWTTLVGGRRYRMQVTAGGTPFNWDYGLAWTTTATIGWTGASGGVWKDNDSAAANWIKGSTASGFLDGEHVVFNDTGIDNTVDIVGSVAPGSILVDNSAQNYSFNGGPIVGATGLIKRGTGMLAINNTNGYTGETIVQNGSVQIGVANGLSAAGRLSVTGPGLFDLNGFNQSLSGISGNGQIVVGAGTLTVGAGNGNSEYSGTFLGTGEILKIGSGTATFRSGHSFAGGITVQDGYLTITANNALGTAVGATVVADGGALVLVGPVNYSTPETIILNGSGEAGFGALENQAGDNLLAGTISLSSDSRIGMTAGIIRHHGLFQIPAGTTMTKDGGGQLQLRGSLDFGGASVVSVVSGTLLLQPNLSTATISIANPAPVLRIQGTGVARIAASTKNPLADSTDPTRRVAVENHVPAGFVVEIGAVAIDTLTGNGGTLINSSGSLSATHIRQSSLTLNSGTSRAVIRSDGTPLGTSVLGQLTMASSSIFDLNNNDLILRANAGNKDAIHADIEAKIKSAQNGVDTNFITRWDGPGITSSAARTASVAAGFDLVSLGVIRNSDLDITTGLPGSTYTTFGGQPVLPDDVLVKYTYTGDGNLDGAVTFDDYAAMDAAFFETIPNVGWATGDVNFDGLINFDDYAVIDQTFFQQGPPLTSDVPAAPLFFQAASATAVVAVPEPATATFALFWLLITIAALSLSWRS
jgi:autotransporter-associated beta strand protein